MRQRLLVVSLVPSSVLGGFLKEVQSGYRGEEIAVLAGAPPHGCNTDCAANCEMIDWKSQGGLRLVAELRRRRFDRAVVLHGGDQYATRAYWRGAAVALVSGARERAFREAGRSGESGTAVALVGGAGRAALQMVEEMCVAAIGVLLLAPLLVAIGVTDLTEALAGGHPGRSAAGPRKR